MRSLSCCFWHGLGYVYLAWIGYSVLFGRIRLEMRVRRAFKTWLREGVL